MFRHVKFFCLHVYAWVRLCALQMLFGYQDVNTHAHRWRLQAGSHFAKKRKQDQTICLSSLIQKDQNAQGDCQLFLACWGWQLCFHSAILCGTVIKIYQYCNYPRSLHSGCSQRRAPNAISIVGPLKYHMNHMHDRSALFDSLRAHPVTVTNIQHWNSEAYSGTVYSSRFFFKKVSICLYQLLFF